MEEFAKPLSASVSGYKYLKYFVFILFNVALFYFLYIWVLKSIHLAALVHDIELISPATIISVFVLGSFNMALYGSRLSLLLRSSFMQGFAITSVGYGINNIAPFRLGELYRIYYAHRHCGLKTTTVVAATMIERYLDLIMILALGFLLVMFDPSTLSYRIVSVFLILMVCAVSAFLLYRSVINKQNMIYQFLARTIWVRSFLDALVPTFSAQKKSPLIVLSVLIWLLLLSLYFVYFHFNLQGYHFKIEGAIFLCFATTLLFAIPYTLAGFGAFESAILFYLINVMDVPSSKALAIALVFHFSLALPQVLWMLFVYFKSFKRGCAKA